MNDETVSNGGNWAWLRRLGHRLVGSAALEPTPEAVDAEDTATEDAGDMPGESAAAPLAPIFTIIPESEPVRLVAHYPEFRDYYAHCELQTKRWCVRNIQKDWRIFDVGANIGYYSVLFGRMAREGLVVAFEPTTTVEMLVANLAANDIANVAVRRVAMGNRAGSRQDAIFRLWGQDAEVEEFPFSTVDAEMRRLGWDRLDLLKIDTDSFDFEVLKGAAETLDRFNPFVLVEINHALAKRQQSVSGCLEWLAGQGYEEAYILDEENFLLKRPAGRGRAPAHGIRLVFEREPVYCPSGLIALDTPAATVADEPALSGVGQFDPSTGDLIVDGPAWSYGLAWDVTPSATGLAIVRITLDVSDADVGVLCVREGFAERLGDEVFIAPGGEITVEIAIERVEELAGVVIRKGPNTPGAARVRYGHLLIWQAMLDASRQPPLSIDPRIDSVALDDIASGLTSSIPAVPRARLEIVDVHRLGERLSLPGPFTPPERTVLGSLGHFRMETHDAQILAQLYRAFNPRRHLEFGTWEGFGATLCARNCDAHIWTLNLPDGETDSSGRNLYGHTAGEATDAGDRIGHLYREAGFADRVTQLLMDSRDFDVAAFGAEFFDTILIDGGHTADVVASDTEKALAVARTGGIILWHDFCPDPTILVDHPAARGVAEAVLTNWDRWRGRFSDLFWIRPSWILLGVVAARPQGEP
jgi:FkbM family methyltransferase